jgi:hypothetical protein
MFAPDQRDSRQVTGPSLRLRHSLAFGGFALDILGTYVHPPTTGMRVGETICFVRVKSFSDSTMKKLRTVVLEQLKHPETPTPEMCDLLGELGKEARDENIPPEQVIVSFKQLWNDLAESLRPQHVDQYERLRQRLVTLCIKAYYAE